MADLPISELVPAIQVRPNDLFVLEQDGTAKKLTGQTLENWLVSFADGHGGIQKIEKVKTVGLVDTYRITLADTTTYDFTVTNARSINSISKISTVGLVDTYQIKFNDNTVTTYTVTNGAKGETGDAWYVWIKYASQQPTDQYPSIGDIPDNWMGIYSGTSPNAPSNWRQYQWYRIRGDQGPTGNPATLSSTKVEYQASTSGTVVPSGIWTSNIPTVPQGQYLWSRTTMQFNTGGLIVSYSVSRFGLDGSGSVSSVCNVSPDSKGNVNIHASDVNAVSVDGDTLQGPLDMNGNALRNLNDPTALNDAVPRKYVDSTRYSDNLLDNSNFTNVINQRGYQNNSECPPGGFPLDRWFNAGSNTTQFGFSPNGLICKAGAVLAQNLEFKINMDVVTLFVTLEDGTTGALNARVTMNVDGSYKRCATTSIGNKYKMHIDTQQGLVYILIDCTQQITIRHAALYIGNFNTEMPPKYVPKSTGQDLAECMRYFQIINSLFGTDIGTTQRQMLLLPVTMRTTPTVTVNINTLGSEVGADYTFMGAGPSFVDIQYELWGSASILLDCNL